MDMDVLLSSLSPTAPVSPVRSDSASLPGYRAAQHPQLPPQFAPATAGEKQRRAPL
jgi:hypothetical protein